jgi:hypothetical protein
MSGHKCSLELATTPCSGIDLQQPEIGQVSEISDSSVRRARLSLSNRMTASRAQTDRVSETEWPGNMAHPFGSWLAMAERHADARHDRIAVHMRSHVTFKET